MAYLSTTLASVSEVNLFGIFTKYFYTSQQWYGGHGNHCAYRNKRSLDSISLLSKRRGIATYHWKNIIVCSCSIMRCHVTEGARVINNTMTIVIINLKLRVWRHAPAWIKCHEPLSMVMKREFEISLYYFIWSVYHSLFKGGGLYFRRHDACKYHCESSCEEIS